MKENPLQKQATTLLIAGVIYNVVIGVLYTWSVYSGQIRSEWNWTAQQAGLPFSVGLVCFALCVLIGGRLQVKIPARIIGTIGAFMVGLGMILTGFIGNNPTMVVIFFGVITGMGIGFGYCSFTPTALKWYHPSRKGFVSGWIIGGFGLTAVYLAPLSRYLIGAFGLQTTFMIIGAKVILIGVPLAQFIKSPPEGYEPPAPVGASSGSSAKIPEDKTWQEMLATKKFYMLFFMFLCSVSIGQMVISNISSIATLQVQITDTGLIAGLVAFMALMNASGRIIGGMMSDKIGWANTLLVVFVLHLVNMLGFAHYDTLPLLIGGIVLAGFCFGTTLSVYPAITVDQYGVKNYGLNYGIMYLAFGFAGLTAPVIASYFFDLNGNYNTVYLLCAAGMVVMIFTNFLIRNVLKKEKVV